MQLRSFFMLFIGLFINQLSFGAACPISTSSTSVGSSFSSNCTVTGTSSTIQLNFKNGFDDTTFVSASGGNNGTTVGAQRKLSFIKAAEVLADQIKSSQPILVDADFSALACDASVATLGSAGPATFAGNVSPMPNDALFNTFYPIGLINSIGNRDYRSSLSDINASFNINLGKSDCLSGSFWYYGFDAPSGHSIGFTTVLLHEMTHGLGFSSLTNASTGEKPSGIDDIFSNFLYSLDNSASWSVADGLSNGQRAASAVSGDALLWNGSSVNAEAVDLLTAGFHDADNSSSFSAGDRVQMYAPNPFVGGSSVSHFDTAASPNEIMEPQYTAGQLDLGLALYLLKDIGWGISTGINATIEVAGTHYSDGDRFVLPINTTQVNVNDGTGDYSYHLDYNSADVTSLITSNSNGFALGLPESGEFSGDYTLTITDSNNGDVTIITVIRPLRLNWSATSLLNGNTEQTLKIEGGAAGTVYSLRQSGFADLIFRDSNGASIISAAADNNAETFNAAEVFLDSEVVDNVSSMDVTVESRYDDVIETGVKVYPASVHNFTVKSSSDAALANSTATLTAVSTLLSDLNIATVYNANTTGEFTIQLPNTNSSSSSALPAGTDYPVRIAAAGYNFVNLNIDSDNTQHNVVLTEISSSIIVSGSIRAQGNQNFLQSAPIVTFRYLNGSSESINVSVASTGQASFTHEIDLNLKSLDVLNISQLDSATVQLNVSNITQTQNINVALFNNENGAITRTTTTATNSESSSSGGSFVWFSILLLGVLRLRSMQ